MLLEQRLRNTRLDDGAGGGGGSGDPPGEKKKSATPIPASESEAKYLVQLAQCGGSHEVLAKKLWGEALVTRQRHARTRDELAALQARNPQGSLVLVGEDVTNYNTYKTFGKPAEVKAKLDSEARLQGELAASKRKETRAAAAKAHGFNAAVLSDRLDLAQFDVEMREVTENGAKKSVAHVRKAGDDKAAWEPLTAVAERDWKDYLPALKSSGGDTAGGGGSGAGTGSAVEFPNNGAGPGTAGSITDRFIANRDKANAARPNPLKAQGAAQKSA